MNSLFELLWYGYYYLSKTHTITTKDIISSPDEYFFKQSNKIIHLDETSLYTREELMYLIVRWKEEVKLKFYIHTYHSNYLLCYFLLDLLDLLSNECKDIQTNFELIFENPMKKDDFIKEIKLFPYEKFQIIFPTLLPRPLPRYRLKLKSLVSHLLI